MPWRLVSAILILVFIVGFIGFNLENSCDLSFGFQTLTAVPVYLTVFSSFALGLCASIPYIVGSSLHKHKKKVKESSPLPVPAPATKTKKRARSRGKGNDEISLEDGSYGID
ncbi:hypothetical protein MASR2M78_04010 [Treponema sp.]